MDFNTYHIKLNNSIVCGYCNQNALINFTFDNIQYYYCKCKEARQEREYNFSNAIKQSK